MTILDRIKRGLGLGCFCGCCGSKKLEIFKGWKEYGTGSCSATDWGNYWLCPKCQLIKETQEKE